MKRYCARDFSTGELEKIRQLIKDNPKFHRAGLSREVCRLLKWHKADGALKEMSCRVAMLRMNEDGLIELPPPRRTKPPARPFCPSSKTDPREVIDQPVHQLGALKLIRINSSNSLLWNEYIERYHYLGFKPLAWCPVALFCDS